MESLSAKDLRTLDEKAKELGLNERILIENASSNLFAEIDKLNLGKKALVISGRGNNGADVLSCERKLYSRGYSVQVAIITEKELGAEALFQKDILEKIKVPITLIKEDNVKILEELLKDVDFILEGILGIGVKGSLSPFLVQVISKINNSKKRVVSCDIPSGLDPDTGNVLGAAVKADYTISFIGAKRGFFLNEGDKLCGKIIVVDIGISKDILINI